MAKDRYAVTCNGRTAFYACMYEDIRQCAMDCGWAVALHGSLASDMDIMAMPWVDNAVSFKEMVDRVSKLFKDNDVSSQYVITYNEKPYNRVVATIPIFADFYLDISTITADVVPKSEVDFLRASQNLHEADFNEIKAELELRNAEIETLKAHLMVSETEVAERIFAEIERMCIDTFGNFNHRVFAELKKKYTEKKECPDCRYFVGCEKAVWVGTCGRYEEMEEMGRDK